MTIAAAATARRLAPRRSPRPSLRLRRARNSPPRTETENRITSTVEASFWPIERAGSCSRSGRVHGAMSSKLTGRPRYDAASTRIDGSLEAVLSHADCTSANDGGFHRRAADVHSESLRTAISHHLRCDRFEPAQLSVDGENHPHIAGKLQHRRIGRRRRNEIEIRVSLNRRGLCLYQKNTTGWARPWLHRLLPVSLCC